MRFYVLALSFPRLVQPLILLLGSNEWKERENSPFFGAFLLQFYYWRMVVCVFLLKMIETDKFNNTMREQQVILEVKHIVE